MFLHNQARRKVLLIGLDCAAPELVFDRWLDDLPNIRQVLRAGVYGRLRSSTPPITVPAWMSMLTGRDPGQLGIYGFHNRADYSYTHMRIASSASVRERALWDLLGDHGKRSIVIGVPPTYPVRPIPGDLISCFLTPSDAKQFTYPAELGATVRKLVGDYMVDVKGFRTDNKGWLLEQIYEMTEKRFKVAKHLLATRPWDLFALVEIGVDRIHHGFWQFMDQAHVLYPGPNPFQNAIYDYHKYVDGLIGELLAFADDDTTVLIVSDHGAKRMDGSIAINEWLVQQGYLVLNHYPSSATRFAQLDINWAETSAWSEGGYYARVFINVEGREPSGVVPQAEYASFRQILKEQIESIPDASGQPLHHLVVGPDELYREVRNVAPDLFVFFGDLYWRSAGTVGHGLIHLLENDTGPDGANHDWDGIFIMAQGQDLRHGAQLQEQRVGLQLLDVAPTVLRAFDLGVPDWMQGRIVPGRG
ncbi:MAG TPA: alkaline phosphatase family protein [Herpetosiphonaceae bacterium]